MIQIDPVYALSVWRKIPATSQQINRDAVGQAKLGLAGALKTMLMSALFRRFMSYKSQVRQHVCLAYRCMLASVTGLALRPRSVDSL
jgi:hypothetical protein